MICIVWLNFRLITRTTELEPGVYHGEDLIIPVCNVPFVSIVLSATVTPNIWCMWDYYRLQSFCSNTVNRKYPPLDYLCLGGAIVAIMVWESQLTYNILQIASLMLSFPFLFFFLIRMEHMKVVLTTTQQLNQVQNTTLCSCVLPCLVELQTSTFTCQL